MYIPPDPNNPYPMNPQPGPDGNVPIRYAEPIPQTTQYEDGSWGPPAGWYDQPMAVPDANGIWLLEPHQPDANDAQAALPGLWGGPTGGDASTFNAYLNQEMYGQRTRGY